MSSFSNSYRKTPADCILKNVFPTGAVRTVMMCDSYGQSRSLRVPYKLLNDAIRLPGRSLRHALYSAAYLDTDNSFAAIEPTPAALPFALPYSPPCARLRWILNFYVQPPALFPTLQPLDVDKCSPVVVWDEWDYAPLVRLSLRTDGDWQGPRRGLCEAAALPFPPQADSASWEDGERIAVVRLKRLNRYVKQDGQSLTSIRLPAEMRDYFLSVITSRQARYRRLKQIVTGLCTAITSESSCSPCTAVAHRDGPQGRQEEPEKLTLILVSPKDGPMSCGCGSTPGQLAVRYRGGLLDDVCPQEHIGIDRRQSMYDRFLAASRRVEAMTLAEDMCGGTGRRTPFALAVLLLGCAAVTMGQQLVEGPLSGDHADKPSVDDARSSYLRIISPLHGWPTYVTFKHTSRPTKLAGYCMLTRETMVIDTVVMLDKRTTLIDSTTVHCEQLQHTETEDCTVFHGAYMTRYLITMSKFVQRLISVYCRKYSPISGLVIMHVMNVYSLAITEVRENGSQAEGRIRTTRQRCRVRSNVISPIQAIGQAAHVVTHHNFAKRKIALGEKSGVVGEDCCDSCEWEQLFLITRAYCPVSLPSGGYPGAACRRAEAEGCSVSPALPAGWHGTITTQSLYLWLCQSSVSKRREKRAQTQTSDHGN
ncbi:hypothetical protein Bbelb_208400 [Branchiostoma belcheri]|nr:hypothetical protein Bbelb_208400 [Branchiostoma belcheri]